LFTRATDLRRTENLQVREKLIHARARQVKITEERLCPVCQKHLGTSAFAAYPNGIVVHYRCRTSASNSSLSSS
jgi:hypothetical protein